MKVVTVVGARPQFIKEAAVSAELRKEFDEVLVHTGQHFDYNMSEQFFEELSIPKPDYNLGISGGTHAQMTGKMMMAIEEVLIKEKPDWLLVFGDTNSTLAAALSAAKLKIPICHVEAGARTHCMTNPEEINRICTDHVSTLLLASAEDGFNELKKEGLGSKSLLVGNTMYDAFVKYSNVRRIDSMKLELLTGEEIDVPDKYYYLTCHREENTSEKNLSEILKAMNSLDYPTVYPVHPRNRELILKLGDFPNILFVKPVGYLESVCLVKNAEKIVTDSGGLQTEAFFAGKKCVTVLDFVCWPETMVNNRNELSRPIAEEIVEKISHEQIIDENYKPFGDGKSAVKIVRALVEKSKQLN
ncbi:MAG: UDP-N-acetylglucosamine 2-epimerase (non-hydrolyzing) [Lachnospiraceae bacterium]|nr:UDP-N-acetylglucosamine 2-epimerase (non-hydrolyzing) [Lachnospiraceae bacterium]